MKRALDDAFVEVADQLPTLLAVVLSVAPDGVIAWAWSRDHQPKRALAFAALQRTATLCLDGLEDGGQLERLLLTSDKTWIASRPLRDREPGGERLDRAHLVLTTAFSGELQTGMSVVHGARVRARVRDIVDAHARVECLELRDRLVELLQTDAGGLDAMRELCDELGLEPAALARLAELEREPRRQLAVWLARRVA
jgi:hypothetical protein